MFKDYLRLGVFAAALLLGVQVPTAVEQYYQIVHAHLIEAQKNLSGFKRTADKFFSGDMDALVAYYHASQDPVFQSDAENIRAMMKRVELLRAELKFGKQAWYTKTWHVVFQSDRELMNETFDQYSYVVPLNQYAVIWGVGTGVFFILLLDLLLILTRFLIRARGVGHPSSMS